VRFFYYLQFLKYLPKEIHRMNAATTALTAKVATLGTAVASLQTLTDLLKTAVDTLTTAGGTLPADDLAAIQAASSAVDADVAAIGGTVTKDTPA
jgi:hypothetical protein